MRCVEASLRLPTFPLEFEAAQVSGCVQYLSFSFEQTQPFSGALQLTTQF